MSFYHRQGFFSPFDLNGFRRSNTRGQAPLAWGRLCSHPSFLKRFPPTYHVPHDARWFCVSLSKCLDPGVSGDVCQLAQDGVP